MPVKLNPKQVAASASGAVASALIASLFGEKGTVIGVALGSVVATTSTAMVMQSIERTHEAVKQVARSPQRLGMLRRAGATKPAGDVAQATEGSAVTEVAGSGATLGVAGTAAAIDGGSDVGDAAAATGRVEGPATGAPGPAAAEPNPTATSAVPAEGRTGTGTTGQRRLVASSRQAGAAGRTTVGGAAGGAVPRDHRPHRRTASARGGTGTRIRWPALVLSIVVVFVVTLGVITAVELLAGKPIASIVGSSKSTGGTSLGNLVSPSPTTTTLPTTGTSTTTTSTTAPTATTTPGSSTTSTTGVSTTSTTGTTGTAPTTTSTSTTTTTTTTPAARTTTGSGSPAGGG